MKNLFLSFLSFLVFLIGCSNEITTPSTSSGKLLLKIDKLNAPSDVTFVKAYLTRENLPPLAGFTKLLSDSTAELLLDQVDAGNGHT